MRLRYRLDNNSKVRVSKANVWTASRTVQTVACGQQPRRRLMTEQLADLRLKEYICIYIPYIYVLMLASIGVNFTHPHYKWEPNGSWSLEAACHMPEHTPFHICLADCLLAFKHVVCILAYCRFSMHMCVYVASSLDTDFLSLIKLKHVSYCVKDIRKMLLKSCLLAS